MTIDDDSGDYLGVLNDGATIQVTKNAGRYLADSMTRGNVIVEGDAGYGVGAYCYGGHAVVKGNAGDFTAVMNKGATIIVQGDVGDDVATFMLAGDLVIVGNAGKNLGNYLIRGNIYIGGEWESLGHNTLLEQMSPADTPSCAATSTNTASTQTRRPSRRSCAGLRSRFTNSRIRKSPKHLRCSEASAPRSKPATLSRRLPNSPSEKENHDATSKRHVSASL